MFIRNWNNQFKNLEDKLKLRRESISLICKKDYVSTGSKWHMIQLVR